MTGIVIYFEYRDIFSLLGSRIYMLFASLGPYARPRAQFFSIRTSRLANKIFIIFFYLFLRKLLSALLVTTSLLSAGGQDGNIPPAHETSRNQSNYRILFILPACAPPKKQSYLITYILTDTVTSYHFQAFYEEGRRLDGKKIKSNAPSDPVPLGPVVVKRCDPVHYYRRMFTICLAYSMGGHGWRSW